VERKWWTLLAVCLGTFMLLVDVTIVNVALPSIQDDLHASFAQLQWVVDAYALALAALLLTAGSLADMFGRRLLFLIGLAVFTAGSLLCALATGPLFLVLARAGQGIGGAIMFATSLALLAQAFHGRERGTAFAVWGAVTGAAVAVGPVLGGVITTGWTWRGIFYVNIPIGAVAIAVTVPRVAESRDANRRREIRLAIFAEAYVDDRIDDQLVLGIADPDDRPDLQGPSRLCKRRRLVAQFEIDAVEEVVLIGVWRDEQRPELERVRVELLICDREGQIEPDLPPVRHPIGEFRRPVQAVIGGKPSGKRRIGLSPGHVIEVLLDRELADRRDAGVVDLDFIGRVRLLS